MDINTTPTEINNSSNSNNNTKINHLVIDTNAIINGMTLKDTADFFYTCPEVMAELRSAHSREYLTRLPFEIKIENPTEESLKAVINFSKKTGDYSSLSMPDLRVIALAHSIEARRNGLDNIRTEPLKTRPTGTLASAPPPKNKIKVKTIEVDDDGWEVVAPTNKGTKKSNKPTKKTKATAVSTETPSAAAETTDDTTNTSSVTETQQETTQQPEVKEQDVEVHTLEEKLSDIVIEEVEPGMEFEGDDGEWITPENVDEFNALKLGVTPAEFRRMNVMDVACMTSDFAMQNVLLQMNLNLVSTGGHRISKIKNWVLRCHACFTVTGDVEKKFCPKCGSATLMRVSCTTNSKGETRYHLVKSFQYRLRGTKYDIPNPKGGRKANNIVLREDQREYVKAQETKSKKKIVDLFDPDFVPLYSNMETKTMNNNMFGTDVIGFGRRNPNQGRKRTGKGKKRS
ncbi:Nin one binding Zn-ribbon like-domain-containing protein [Absidia repens]|uniref:20S-pre-rRNA D-site endonuclease NOB1 n=1 Tax=Absidia repens TaxID=90262 RepID=A0A1X2IKW1_9FUNG|nr:Nin one binding Zn-ribbon like-domain-containing protein [Absidia repens]